MNQFLLKTAKLTKSGGAADSHMLQALLHELKDDMGHVFALYYIEGRPNQAREQVAITIHDHIDRFHQTTTRGMNIARRFEHMLQAINEELTLLGQDFQRIPLSQLHCVFGVVTSNQLYLSGLGDLLVRYLHHTNQSRYAVYDLHAQFEPPESTSWEKVFVTVLDGELHQNDIFYVGLPLSNREISDGDLQDILITLPPAGALKRIEQHSGVQQPYAGICMRIEPPRIKGDKKKVNPIASLEDLNSTRSNTSTVLGESPGDFVGSVKRTLEPVIQKLHRPGDRGIASIARQALRLLLKGLILLLQGLFALFCMVAPVLRSLWSRVTSEGTKRAVQQGVQRIGGFARSARGASRRAYITVGVVGLVLLLTFFGIRGIINSSQRQDLVVQAERIIDTATERRDQASARLIFNDREGAQLLLTEAITLLDSAPDVRSMNDEIEALRLSITDVLNETRGVISPELDLLVSSDTTLTASSGDPSNLFVLNANGVISRFNSATSALDLVADQQSALGSIESIFSDGSTVYVVDENRQLGRVNGSNTVSAITSGLNRLSDLVVARLYNGNIYGATNSVQQIFRFLPQGESFDGGTAWIVSNDTDLSNMQDIAIDGNIYVLTPSSLLRYQSGRQTTFILEDVEPSLSGASHLFVTVDTDSIYIIEPMQSRVLVFSKEGAFLAQYVNDVFGQAVGITVDETNNTAYIVTPDGIHSFSLTHRL